jgi:predicted alpha/beta-fold hydrolase
MKNITILILALVAAVAVRAEAMELDHPLMDGLYSTLTTPFATGGIQPKNDKGLYLDVPGFKDHLYVRMVLHSDCRPLVVILNGTCGQAKDSITSLWMAWLEDRFHVLTFDSTLHPAFTEAARMGVAGYMDADAESAAAVIGAFLKHPKVQGKVSRIGVVGMSYGGTQALLLERMQRQKKLSFRIDAVQAYSPPVSMASAMNILDCNFTYRWTLAELFWKFYNLPRNQAIQASLDPQRMRAALSRVFRLSLTDVVERNDRLHDRELKAAKTERVAMPESNSRTDRLPYAEVVSFNEYLDRIVVPYWKARGRIESKEEILQSGELRELLSGAGANVQAIVTTNDPLNETGSVERLHASSHTKRLTVLPRGGHLGYANAQWTKSKLLGIFEDAAIASSVSGLLLVDGSQTAVQPASNR